MFSSMPRSPSAVNRLVKKHPSVFGIPFLLLMVGASYGLTIFTQARYDLHDQKVKNVCFGRSLITFGSLKSFIFFRPGDKRRGAEIEER